jgi:hypothetical protein
MNVGFELPAGFQLTDDMDVAFDPSEYQVREAPLPVLAGIYGVRITKAGLKKVYGKEETQLVKDENGVPKFPILVINEIEIAEPSDVEGVPVGRKVFPQGFGQEYGTKPFKRKDFGGREHLVNNLADIIAATPSADSFRGTDEGLQLLQQYTAEGRIFYVELDWLARDGKYIGEQVKLIDAAKEAGRINEEEAKKALSEIRYRTGQQEGMRKFVESRPDGSKALNPMWESPSGETIEAKNTIRQFIAVSQLGRFRLGPKKV